VAYEFGFFKFRMTIIVCMIFFTIVANEGTNFSGSNGAQRKRFFALLDHPSVTKIICPFVYCCGADFGATFCHGLSTPGFYQVSKNWNLKDL